MLTNGSMTQNSTRGSMAAGPHYPQLLQHIDKLTGNTVGATTLANSPWIMLVNVPLQPVFAGQPDHVEVIWSYGLWTTATESLVPQTNPGLHRRKVRPRVTPSRGAGDADEATAHLTRIPYITSQFMSVTLTAPDTGTLVDVNTNMDGGMIEDPMEAVFKRSLTSCLDKSLKELDPLACRCCPSPTPRGACRGAVQDLSGHAGAP